jgi:hypothetical protein
MSENGSQRLFEELEEINKKVLEVKEKQVRLLRDPALTDLVLDLMVAERVLNPNHERIKEIHGEIRIRREAMEKEVKEVEDVQDKITSRLRYLTTPVIQKCVEDLMKLQKERKLNREILNKQYDGLRKRWFLDISSNEQAILRVRNLGEKSVAELEGMVCRPIKEIMETFERYKSAIESIDCEKLDVLTIAEEEYFRGGPPPQGSVGSYSGSLTGMPMPPLQKPLSVEEAKTGSKWPFGRED